MYDIGDLVPLGLAVTDADGNPADGGTVVLVVGLPDDTTATPSVQHPDAGSGRYTVDYPATMEGLHTVRWTVTGANASTYSDVFNVREVTDQLISLTQAKLQLGVTSASHDDDLRLFIAAAGLAIENHVCRTVVRRTFTEHVKASNGTVRVTRTPTLDVVAMATVDGTVTWTPSDLAIDGDAGIVTAMTGTGLTGQLVVTYVAGLRVVPANYLLAGRIILDRLWETMRPFVSNNAAMGPGALDDSLDARAGSLVGYAIPNAALQVLGKPPPLVA